MSSPPAADARALFLAALAVETAVGVVPPGATRPLFPHEMGTVNFGAISGAQEEGYARTAAAIDKVKQAVMDSMTAAIGGVVDPEALTAAIHRFAAEQTPEVAAAIRAQMADIQESLMVAYGKGGLALISDAAAQGVTAAGVKVAAERGAYAAEAAPGPTWIWQRLTAAAVGAGGVRQPPAAEVIATARATDPAGGYDLGRQGVNVATGEGRSNAAEQLPPPLRVYSSELLDTNTCRNCAAVDGREYASQAEAEIDYPGGGGYRGCSGGARCRGTLVYVWGESGPPPPPAPEPPGPPPVPGPTAPQPALPLPPTLDPWAADPAVLTEDQLAESMSRALTMETAEAEAWVDRVAAELDAREDAARKADAVLARHRANSAARRDARLEAQSLKIGDLMATGQWNEAEAISEVTGKPLERVQRDLAMQRLRADGYTGRSFEDLARASYNRYVNEQRIASESVIRGGDELSKAGLRQLARLPKEQQATMRDRLWTGTEEFARKWASPELLQWWDEHGRPVYATWKDHLLTNGRIHDVKRGTWLA